MGAPDPRLNDVGVIDYRLRTLYKAFTNMDPAPNRVKPMPIQVLHRAQRMLHQSAHTTIADKSAMDMIWIAYFFLLRPGEYVKAHDNSPLCLKDVTFMIRSTRINHMSCHVSELDHVTHASLTFDDQKNRERGETIGHRLSGDAVACPVRALARRAYYLRRNNATPDTPLCTYYSVAGRALNLDNKYLADILKAAAVTLPDLNYLPTDIVPRSLRSGGAMALLCGRVDTKIIQLVGRWKSDAIFRYLHAQALPLITDLSRTMLRSGAFQLLPGSNLPPQALPILEEDARLRQSLPPLGADTAAT